MFMTLQAFFTEEGNNLYFSSASAFKQGKSSKDK